MKIFWVPRFVQKLWEKQDLQSGESNPSPSSDALPPQSSKTITSTKPYFWTFTNRDKKLSQSKERLITLGAKEENLNENNLSIYRDLYFSFKKKGWEIDGLTADFAMLINANTPTDALEIYSDLIYYYRACNCKTDKLTESFHELVSGKPSSEEWKVYKNITDYHIDNGWHVDNLTSSFTKLVNAKPNDENWNYYKDTIALFKERNWELNAFTHYVSYLIKSKASQRLLESYRNNFSEYKNGRKSLFDLTKSYYTLASVKSSLEQIELIEKSIGFLKDFKNEPECFGKQFAKVLKEVPNITSEKLSLYCDTYAQLTFLGLDTKEFTATFFRLTKQNLTDEKWELYKSIIELPETPDPQITKITSSFSNLVEKNLEQKDWDLIKSSLDYNKRLGFLQFILIPAFDTLFYLKPKGIDFCKNAIEEFKNEDLPLVTLISGLAGVISHDDTFLLAETYINALKFDFSKSKEAKLGSSASDIRTYFFNLAKLDPPKSMLRTFNIAISEGKFKTKEESLNFLRDLVVHSALCNLIKNKSPEYIKRVQDFISSFVRNDPVPYPQIDFDKKPHPEGQKVYSEVLRVYRRAFNIYHGFSSLTFETKRTPTKEPPLLAQFGNDVAKSVHYINARDINQFPGRGFVISSLIPERIFASDKNSEDPFHRYKESWPWAKDAIDDLNNSHFIFTRGMIAVSCFDNDKYQLKDINDKKIHFSYVIFNDHHHNYSGNIAFLVPTHILRKKLTGATIPYSDYVGFSTKAKDINEVGLTPEELIKEASLIPANILNLGWGSNVGGLCNTYPLDSSPYHEWEKVLRPEHTTDIYGRVHKSHMTGDYQWYMSSELDKMLIPLREAHNEVYSVTTRYQNLLDLFRLSLAMWHKGETLGETITPPDKNDDYLFEKETRDSKEQKFEYSSDDSHFLNTNSLRMLVEAYKWHEARNNGKNNKNDFPVLVVADSLDYWNKPNSPIILDTYDMSLSTGKEKIQLPLDSNGMGIDETILWQRHVMPHAKDSIKDLRFYDRRDLGIN